eukprot:2281397-Pyramimonas_sp.AAC.1
MAVHIHGILLILPTLHPPISMAAGAHTRKTPKYPFLLPMAVYGYVHVSYGRARRHPCMTPL